MRVVTKNIIEPLSDASVVTIGNFDGVHVGHKTLITRCHELRERGQDLAVVCFEPLPAAWFRPESAPARLSSAGQRIRLLEDCGVDLVWMMRFNQELAETTAADFARNVLVDGLSAKHLVTGKDFRFGHQRKGDLELLNRLGGEFGFDSHVMGDLKSGDTKISSTAIRQALHAGNLELAGKYLGRPFTMEGEVIRGQGLGNKLGFPTANMKLEAEPSPLAGVFAVQARITGNEDWLPGVASLGQRPVVAGKEFLVEVHLFDFDKDLYGQRLEVRFVEKLRDEENFSSLDDLVIQMKKDEARARLALKTENDLDN
jgi:riboflavin kinase/FMN adenylyltransferase